MKPLIGITPDRLNKNQGSERPFKYGQSYTYCDAVFRAGGVPVILPIPNGSHQTIDLVSRLDGILFSGGGDIDPARYGQTNRYSQNIDPYRDEFEFQLMDYAYGRQMPVLAICRGMQLLNVHNRGTLYQDIRSNLASAMNHDGYARKPGTEPLTHEIHIDPGSKLARILGTTAIRANTYHHQAVDIVGDSLRAVAWSDDGIIEAIESEDDRFVVGVQSHPEAIVSMRESRWRHLFESFVLAAGEGRT